MTKEVNLSTVLSRCNLEQALKAVKRNQGGPGVDGKDIDTTITHLQQHWPVIKQSLLEGSYTPSPLREVLIPKPNGGERRLGIPTVQDRLIHQALNQRLSESLEETFSAHSYGYRPGRSAHDAVQAGQRYYRSGKQWVVDIDLSSFFDEVNHDRLLHLLYSTVQDVDILRLIKRLLRSGIRGKAGVRRTDTGLPQGSPLSPLLANVYLSPLDRELEARGLDFVRYADDLMIYVGSERSAKRVYESVTKWLSTHLDLPVNDTKSGIGLAYDRPYLGYQLTRGGDLRISSKSLKSYQDKVRQVWSTSQGLSPRAEVLRMWKRYIHGWCAYFKLAKVTTTYRRLGGWTRRHMRKCFWLRWHNRRGRHRALSRLGIRGRSLKVASSALGAWRIARSPTMQQALPTRRLQRLGLWSIDDLLGA